MCWKTCVGGPGIGDKIWSGGKSASQTPCATMDFQFSLAPEGGRTPTLGGELRLEGQRGRDEGDVRGSTRDH
jgi:hypothetical protein